MTHPDEEARRWREYAEDCAAAGVEPKTEPPPVYVLPSNLDAWRAWKLVCHCRQVTLGGLAGLDWGAVAKRLELHGLWSADVERKLGICEAAMLSVKPPAKE